MSDTHAPTDTTRTCTMCEWCFRHDYGYSNWTTEGAELYCLKGLNPTLDGMEQQYGDPTPELAAALDVAKTCAAFREGAPAWMDVEREEMVGRTWYDEPYHADQLVKYADAADVREALARHLNGETP